MNEYPWYIENMMLSQHDQPCDCVICDQIHMAREMRRKYRRPVTNCDKLHSCAQVDCPYCEIDRLRELNTKLLTEKCELKADLEKQVRNCNEAWSEATGGNYPAHAEKIIEALRSSVQFWKDETRRSVESGDLAYAKAMRLYATMVAENEELKETVKQVEQSAINFHDAWQQALNDLESVRAENAELRNINQSLSVANKVLSRRPV